MKLSCWQTGFGNLMQPTNMDPRAIGAINTKADLEDPLAYMKVEPNTGKGSFSFLKLPSEIRNQIYALVVDHRSPIPLSSPIPNGSTYDVVFCGRDYPNYRLHNRSFIITSWEPPPLHRPCELFPPAERRVPYVQSA